MKIVVFWLKFHWIVPMRPIDKNSALVHKMAWRLGGDNHYLNQWWQFADAYVHLSALVSYTEILQSVVCLKYPF